MELLDSNRKLYGLCPLGSSLRSPPPTKFSASYAASCPPQSLSIKVRSLHMQCNAICHLNLVYSLYLDVFFCHAPLERCAAFGVWRTQEFGHLTLRTPLPSRPANGRFLPCVLLHGTLCTISEANRDHIAWSRCTKALFVRLSSSQKTQ